MRLNRYLVESYDVDDVDDRDGYFGIIYSFWIPDASKSAGIHISISRRKDKFGIEEYWNFGYSVIAQGKSGAVTLKDGRDAKKYYKDDERAYIKVMLFKLVKEFFKRENKKPVILGRGPLSKEKILLHRYYSMGKLLENIGYKYTREEKEGSDIYIFQSKEIL